MDEFSNCVSANTLILQNCKCQVLLILQLCAHHFYMWAIINLTGLPCLVTVAKLWLDNQSLQAGFSKWSILTSANSVHGNTWVAADI